MIYMAYPSDTWMQAFTGKMNGALTYLLAEVLKKLPGPTYGDIFDLIHETFDKVNQGCLVNTRILRRIFDYRLSQVSFSNNWRIHITQSFLFTLWRNFLYLKNWFHFLFDFWWVDTSSFVFWWVWCLQKAFVLVTKAHTVEAYLLQFIAVSIYAGSMVWKK